MTIRNKLFVAWSRIMPANAPTDLAEAFDDLKRGFWKAVAPAAIAKEKVKRVYMEREIAELLDQIEQMEAEDEDTEIEALCDTNLSFRRTIDILQHRVAELEAENKSLKEKLEG